MIMMEITMTDKNNDDDDDDDDDADDDDDDSVDNYQDVSDHINVAADIVDTNADEAGDDGDDNKDNDKVYGDVVVKQQTSTSLKLYISPLQMRQMYGCWNVRMGCIPHRSSTIERRWKARQLLGKWLMFSIRKASGPLWVIEWTELHW